MSISTMVFYFLLVIGFVCAIIGGYLLAILAIQIGRVFATQLETDTILLLLGVLLIGIALWWLKK